MISDELFVILIGIVSILVLSKENRYIIYKNLLSICYKLSKIYLLTVILSVLLFICNVYDIQEMTYIASILFVVLIITYL
jgi:hypothetical protein